jgi:hypothetical protein
MLKLIGIGGFELHPVRHLGDARDHTLSSAFWAIQRSLVGAPRAPVVRRQDPGSPDLAQRVVLRPLDDSLPLSFWKRVLLDGRELG